MNRSRAPGTPWLLHLLLASCLVLGVLLLVAGCSGGGGGGPTGGQPAPATQAAQPPAQATQSPAQPTQPPAQPTSTTAAGGADSSSGAQMDACKLLTKAEVESAAGKPLGEPVSRVTEYAEPSYASSCSYSGPGFEAFVNATVFVGRDAAQAKELYQTHKSAPGITAASAAGVGEDAFWVDTSSTLTILKGRYEVRVSVVNGGLEAVKGLASKVLEKLP